MRLARLQGNGLALANGKYVAVAWNDVIGHFQNLPSIPLLLFRKLTRGTPEVFLLQVIRALEQISYDCHYSPGNANDHTDVLLRVPRSGDYFDIIIDLIRLTRTEVVERVDIPLTHVIRGNQSCIGEEVVVPSVI